MSGTYNDHFAAVAATYADFRPGYPQALFSWLAEQCAQQHLAWDCGTGSGQAALALAAAFARVIATDASAAQIAQAQAHPRIEYRVAPAEASGLDAQGVDLVVVAQALHWFDLVRFYAEVNRVLTPGGLIAAWSYGVLQLDDATLDAITRQFYTGVLGTFWPPERRHVENGYRDLAFPFQRLAAPNFVMSVEWDLRQLLGYIRSWSATARFIKTRGFDPTLALESDLYTQWGSAERLCRVVWPLHLQVGRCA